jgi:GAF domain-containing protein
MSSIVPFVETEATSSLPAGEAMRLVDLAGIALKVHSLKELAESLLPLLAAIMHCPTAFLYVAGPRLRVPSFFPYRLPYLAASELEEECSIQFKAISKQSELQPIASATQDLLLFPLKSDGGCNGFLGLAALEPTPQVPLEALEEMLRIVAIAVEHLLEHAETGQQLAHLNTYVTVNSMLLQTELNLHDLLEGILYCCMDTLSAEAATVLLLDDDMTNLRFYHVEGPSAGLRGATMSVDEGIAGHVLRTQEAVLIDDVRTDPRFHDKYESKTGLQAKSMLVIPLVTGEQPIGVLEVLNKTGGGTFTEDELMLLLSIAEVITLAIRNAKIFEFVANSYCKQRQGQRSCRGCERPLGAWTPCVQYRKTVVSGLWRISDIPGLRPS